jgi:electron transfer flavoprotein alpha subunit
VRLVWKRPALGGKLHASAGEERNALVRSVGCLLGRRAARRKLPVTPLALDLGGLDPGREIRRGGGGERVDLTKARRSSPSGTCRRHEKLAPIEELAKELGAEMGGSRPVIDGGWLPRDRQIGSSGQTVAPTLYIAIGISGAIQHLVGMKGSSVIVAVNKDAGAPIFKVAHYGIVGDLHELVPALSQAIREARG